MFLIVIKHSVWHVSDINLFIKFRQYLGVQIHHFTEAFVSFTDEIFGMYLKINIKKCLQIKTFLALIETVNNLEYFPIIQSSLLLPK